jgi:murein L,D-transpeptidase YafK
MLFPRVGIILAMTGSIGKRFTAVCCAGAIAGMSLLAATKASGEEIVPADRVVVRKSEHRLYLYRGAQLLGTYHVSLGLNPLGQKERERDFRTPEGHYFLARRNTRSDFFLAIQVSYPNKQDALNARRHGWAPGGLIMLHGLPNTLKHGPDYYSQNDWTDGCIAMSNSDMVEIWMRTQDNIPIDIFP